MSIYRVEYKVVGGGTKAVRIAKENRYQAKKYVKTYYNDVLEIVSVSIWS